MTDATRTALYWAGLFLLSATTPVISNRTVVDASNARQWAILGLGVAAACMLVAPLVWRLAARLGSQVRTAVTAVAIGAAFSGGVGGGVTLLGLATAQPRLNQVIVDLTVVSVGAYLLVRLVQRADEREERRAALLEEAVTLHLARADTQRISDRIQLTLASSVEDALGPARAMLTQRLGEEQLPAVDRWATIARGLRETADRTVRDVSRRLWREAVREERPATMTEVLRDIVTRQPFPVGTVILIYLLTSPPDVITFLGPTIGTMNLITGCVLICVVLGGANRLMAWKPHLHALIFVLAIVVLQSFTPLMFVWRALWSDRPYRWVDLVAAVVFGVLIIVLAAGAGSLRRLRTEAEEQFELALSEDFLDTVATNRRLAQLARESARVLHGKVQTRLVACAIAIERAAASEDTQAFLAAMEEARDALATASLDDAAPPTSVQEEVERKAGLWSALCRIDVDITDDTPATLAPTVIRDVGRVVEEGLSNAVRHGRATAIVVRVQRQGDVLVVEVEDDGDGPGRGRPGLGSALLDSVSRSWELRAAPNGSLLRVRLQVRGAEPLSR